MPNRPNRHALTLVTPLLVLLATGCGEDNRELDPYVSTENPRETLTELDYGNLDSAEIRLNLPWSRNKVSRDATPDVPPTALSAVTTESLDGYDRVVFTFNERYPGYALAYATEGGGGCDGTEPAGEAPAHLVVEFDGALSNEGGTPLVEDLERTLDFPALAGAAQVCDEGNRVKWILAAGAQVEYRILEMLGTPRLVVDLRHP
ncbi:MAG: hypothetical protein F4139_13520 [Gemmatimonadetes bacterium]|nr:hypothetical protein [Gemmatimonadota bacterium]MYA63822.1 hypothetical protein [Gemmatimonadota bacterium]MYC00277.1 hypothetical protein [Gemmatimonadota bacterium]MYH53942.1 hypothetical protein [Gemmatimonadota bacterium]MYK66185.1 hypothetical protein [Gemmatimonadota bacterium]